MISAPGLPFTEASQIRPGDKVVHGGTVRTVTAVDNKGRDAPYYKFADHEGSALGNWTSWQVCGKYVGVRTEEGRFPETLWACRYQNEYGFFAKAAYDLLPAMELDLLKERGVFLVALVYSHEGGADPNSYRLHRYHRPTHDGHWVCEIDGESVTSAHVFAWVADPRPGVGSRPLKFPDPVRSPLVPVRSITLTRAEGRSEECGKPRSAASWMGADGHLAVWRLTAPESGYHKCDFTVEFADGFKYHGRYDLCQGDRTPLVVGVQRLLGLVSGRWRPDHWTAEQHDAWIKSAVKGTGSADAAHVLDAYKFTE